MSTFIKLYRENKDIDELLKHPNEWVLLTVIARRASRNGSKILGLKPCEALIGDYKNYGMSEQNYRTAKKNLAAWGFVTFRATNRGTIAKLINSDIYDINAEQPNEPHNGQPTDSQRTGNEQVTTNKNNKKVKNKKEKILTQAEIIYQVYPKHVGKKAALKAITKALKEVSFETLLEKTEEYTVSIEGKDKEFIPHPATWFNQGRWEDDPTEWKSKNKKKVDLMGARI